MAIDPIIALFSAFISFAGLLLVVFQLRASNKQQELASLVEIYDINRKLISLGFSYPVLFEILQDAKNADPVWERRYLQLWLNQISLIHSYLRRSVFDLELQKSLERDIADFMTMENMRRHWRNHGWCYSDSFQKLINNFITKESPPVVGPKKSGR